MTKKYYKVNLNDFNRLDLYGLKRDYSRPSHIKNVIRLNDFYKTRFPDYMKVVEKLQYLNFITRNNQTISDKERAHYGVPNYILVAEIEPNGFFEYTELLTGVTFIISPEAFGGIDELKIEISEEEALILFDDDYIEKISNLFQLPYNEEKKATAKEELKKRFEILTVPNSRNNAFVVPSNQAQELSNQTQSKEASEEISRLAEEFKANNLTKQQNDSALTKKLIPPKKQ